MLDLYFARDSDKQDQPDKSLTPLTRLFVREQRPPLKVIRAFPIEYGGALVHLHNISGGVLSGDDLRLAATVGHGAYAQLTSTSATRIYRSTARGGGASQLNTITVEEGGLLEYLPDPLIPFAGSHYRQRTSISLAEGAGLFWWEMVAPGRLAKGECFEYDVLEMSLAITARNTCTGSTAKSTTKHTAHTAHATHVSQEKLIACEHFVLEPEKRPLSSLARLGPFRYFGSFYICKVGVDARCWFDLERQLGELALQLSDARQSTWGVSTLVSDGLVVRVLSHEGRTITTGLPVFWNAAKQALYGRNAVLPRKVY